MKRAASFFALALLLFITSPPAFSSEAEFKNQLVAELYKYFPQNDIDAIFSDPRLSIDESIFDPGPSQCVLSDGTSRKFLGYLDPDCGILLARSVRRGKEFLETNRELLAAIHKKYGVEPEIIAAILRLESNFGNFLGRHSVLNALYTRYIMYPRRREFVLREIKYFIRIARRNSWDIFEVKGSAWGAFGMAQFIPSSYWHYAVDGDANGKTDLFNLVDSAHSVANYLAVHGWSDNEEDKRAAIWAYNRSDAYVRAILAYARALK